VEVTSEEMNAVAEHLSTSPYRAIPSEVEERAKLHVLDAIASAVSGTQLLAGEKARAWLRRTPGVSCGPCTVFGVLGTASDFAAALCNAVAAHADETDDSHPSGSHPGCSVIPAALATGEVLHSTGKELIRAVVAGYDVGGRIGRAIGSSSRNEVENRPASHPAIGAFCSGGAVASLRNFDSQHVRFMLSYLGQMSSGVRTYLRAPDHVEKAFVYGGMPASQALLAASLVDAGWTASEDIFHGSLNWMEAAYPGCDHTQVAKDLGSEFEIMATSLKKYAVGSPAARAVEAAVLLLENHDLVIDEIEHIQVRLGGRGAFVVGERSMANVNVRYLVAATLLDGGFSFHMAHDDERLGDGRTRQMMDRIELIPDPEMSRTGAVAVTVACRSGERHLSFERTVETLRGLAADPMTWDEVCRKSEDLMSPVLGLSRTHRVQDLVKDLDALEDVAVLTAAIGGQPAEP
jgi:2-methylcitrate dehydratase PrpD